MQTVVQKEMKQHSNVAHVEVKIDDILACDKEVQTEVESSEGIQTINTRPHNKKIQVIFHWP